MLIGLVSTIALVLAISPQLQVLPSETEDPTPAEVERLVEEATDEIADDTTAPIDPAVETPEPLESVETGSTPTSDAEPEPPETDPVLDDPETENSESNEPALAEDDAQIPDDLVAVVPEETDETINVQTGDIPESEWPGLLAAASDALGAAKTARGNFIQSNADGTIVTGTFALNRPGRMRFDYDDPTPVLIVSDGATVAMEDSELETVDRIPIGSTPLGLILSSRLDVDRDVDVLSIQQDEDRIGIRVEDASGELEGTLTMIFAKETYDLLGWLAVDGNLQTTVVDLLNVETNVRIDPRLFRLDEEGDEEDER